MSDVCHRAHRQPATTMVRKLKKTRSPKTPDRSGVHTDGGAFFRFEDPWTPCSRRAFTANETCNGKNKPQIYPIGDPHPSSTPNPACPSIYSEKAATCNNNQFTSGFWRSQARSLMRPRQQAADVEAQPAAWIDDRLASDKLHKQHTQHTQHAQQRRNDGMVSYILRVAILLLVCYMIGVQQLAFTALTSVQCTPQAVLAGSNVTCVITTSPHATETALSVTQVTSGQAGPLFQLEDHAHSHRVTFATRAEGFAGVRVSHLLFWASSIVEVLPGVASSVEVLCTPPVAMLGTNVQCAVSPHDEFGNLAEVEPPPSGAKNFFTVARIGCARDLVVHDTFVAFVAGVPGNECVGNRAGVAVTLDGQRVESTIAVSDPEGSRR